jgi:hypothetical protein
LTELPLFSLGDNSITDVTPHLTKTLGILRPWGPPSGYRGRGRKGKRRTVKRRWKRERKEKGLSGKRRRRRKGRGDKGQRGEEEEIGAKDNEEEKMKYWEK